MVTHLSLPHFLPPSRHALKDKDLGSARGNHRTMRPGCLYCLTVLASAQLYCIPAGLAAWPSSALIDICPTILALHFLFYITVWEASRHLHGKRRQRNPDFVNCQLPNLLQYTSKWCPNYNEFIILILTGDLEARWHPSCSKYQQTCSICLWSRCFASLRTTVTYSPMFQPAALYDSWPTCININNSTCHVAIDC